MAEDITPSPSGDFPSSGRESSLAGEPVDLSAEIPPAARRQIPTAPYNPEPERERMRGWIALSLLAMLAVVLLLAFISMWAGMKAEVLQTVLTIIFGPLVTLVSAATGFYYGTRSSSSSS